MHADTSNRSCKQWIIKKNTGSNLWSQVVLVVHFGASGGQIQTSRDEREHISLLFTLHDSCYDINNSVPGASDGE